MPKKGAGRGRGRYGRQPAYWILRERRIPLRVLGAVVGRSTSYVHAVLTGEWAPDPAFMSAAADFLRLPEKELFTEDLRNASRWREKPNVVIDTHAGRTRIGRFGRQPAYWALREQGIRQAEVAAHTRRSQGGISEVLNGSAVPPLSLVAALSELLDKSPTELFTNELLQASSARDPHATGRRPPSKRVGPLGRQPAYWVLRERGIPQAQVAAMAGRSLGKVSSVLNGHSRPDQRFVDRLSAALGLARTELFNDDALDGSR